MCLAMSQSRGTRVIQEWITRQQSKLSLVTSGLRNFLDYGGGKRVRRRVTLMQTLTLIQIILSSKLDSYGRIVIWNSSKCSVAVASTR